MPPLPPSRRRRALIESFAIICAALIALAAATGSAPLPISESFRGDGVIGSIVFVACSCAARRVLSAVSAAQLRWAVPLGTGFAAAEICGISLLQPDAGMELILNSHLSLRSWVIVHFLGVMAGAILTASAVLVAVDRAAVPVRSTTARGHQGRLFGWILQHPLKAFAALAAVLLIARLPYLVLWWPGLVPFDTFRSYSYVLGIGAWEQYEPVGHSLLIGGMVWLGDLLGLGDSGTVALGASLQSISSALVCAFVLIRLVSWRSPRALWAGALVWFALSPVLAMFSITLVKDAPFTSALLVFMVAFMELLRHREMPPRWAWITLVVAGAFLIVLRNNGVYIVLVSLIVLAAILWRIALRRALLALLACTAVLILYAGPLTAVIGAKPGPLAESWSIPIQQIARIAQDHANSLRPGQRAFIDDVFVEADADTIAGRYDPYISDPMKGDASGAWDTRTTGEFLAGWIDLVRTHPGTAIEATLAATVGYWAPGAPSYDGLILQSSNDVRGVHLELGATAPDDGVRGFVLRHDLLGRGLENLPGLGLLLSPGAMTWVWIAAAVVVVRAGAWRLLAAFVPGAVLLLTVLAGPVSGGMRYSLGLIAGLPLAVVIAAMAVRREDQREGAESMAEGGVDGNTNRS